MVETYWIEWSFKTWLKKRGITQVEIPLTKALRSLRDSIEKRAGWFPEENMLRRICRKDMRKARYRTVHRMHYDEIGLHIGNAESESSARLHSIAGFWKEGLWYHVDERLINLRLLVRFSGICLPLNFISYTILNPRTKIYVSSWFELQKSSRTNYGT